MLYNNNESTISLILFFSPNLKSFLNTISLFPKTFSQSLSPFLSLSHPPLSLTSPLSAPTSSSHSSTPQYGCSHHSRSTASLCSESTWLSWSFLPSSSPSILPSLLSYQWLFEKWYLGDGFFGFAYRGWFWNLLIGRQSFWSNIFSN